ncbi:hypothetical protein PFISCL1PPCAC_24159 [Pristionchus fissidentatus]|uniref:Uncharacterized protein n=1 Tax=Pristionchus fissidentatus TaxID=1538716 RepID=A0AAV5WSZ4_9BILA|nr:hypothetical protein PFISCL1PPCAC_24159 [Pristionchus fissidentatus]
MLDVGSDLLVGLSTHNLHSIIVLFVSHSSVSVHSSAHFNSSFFRLFRSILILFFLQYYSLSSNSSDSVYFPSSRTICSSSSLPLYSSPSPSISSHLRQFSQHSTSFWLLCFLPSSRVCSVLFPQWVCVGRRPRPVESSPSYQFS